MKLPITENLKYKELAKYLKTKESEQDFMECLAKGENWDDYLKEKGLLEEVTSYVEVPMPEIYPLHKQK